MLTYVNAQGECPDDQHTDQQGKDVLRGQRRFLFAVSWCVLVSCPAIHGHDATDPCLQEVAHGLDLHRIGQLHGRYVADWFLLPATYDRLWPDPVPSHDGHENGGE